MHKAVLLLCALLVLLPVIIKSRKNRSEPVPAAFSIYKEGTTIVQVKGEYIDQGVYFMSCVKNMPNSVINVTKGGSAAHTLKCSDLAKQNNNGVLAMFGKSEGGHVLLGYNKITASDRLLLGLPLVLSDMTEADFEVFPGVGPALAKKIVEYRQINGGKLSVDDLKNVNGIGEKKYLLIRPYL